MIELTDQQQRMMTEESPPRAVNPRTQERFVLIPEAVYEQLRQLVAPLNRGWDGDDDLIPAHTSG